LQAHQVCDLQGEDTGDGVDADVVLGPAGHRENETIPGQGTTTSDAMSDNKIGPIAADPGTGTVCGVHAAGEPQAKAKSSSFNKIFVSRSTGAAHRTSLLVFQAPAGTALNNIFPALAADPVTHVPYAAWTDQHGAGHPDDRHAVGSPRATARSTSCITAARRPLRTTPARSGTSTTPSSPAARGPSSKPAARPAGSARSA
jgi:hypothetical protein